MNIIFEPDFTKSADGLIAAIAQDADSSEVLMLAWVNREAWLETLRTRRATYFSRSRQQLWRKGESSGQWQEVVDILADCDGDAVIYKVRQLGHAACHTGRRSCFYRQIAFDGTATVTSEPVLDPDKLYGKS